MQRKNHHYNNNINNDTSTLTARKGILMSSSTSSSTATMMMTGPLSHSRGPPGVVSFNRQQQQEQEQEQEQKPAQENDDATMPDQQQQQQKQPQKMMGSERIVSASVFLPSSTAPPSLNRSHFLSTPAAPLQFATSRGGGGAAAMIEWSHNNMMSKTKKKNWRGSFSSNRQPPGGSGGSSGGGSQGLSPIFAKLCALCTLSILVMAGTLGHLDHQKSLHEGRHYQQTDVQKHRSKARLLRDYMMENGVEEPIYVAASTERYLLEHGPTVLGYNTTTDVLPEGCRVWNDPEVAPDIYHPLHTYLHELNAYNQALKKFTYFVDHQINDIRKLLTGDDEEADYTTCQLLELGGSQQPQHGGPSNNNNNKDLLQTFFSKSGQLSRSLKGGWMEPLLTPMRHPHFCTIGLKGNIINVDYLVHDFAHICRHSLKPHSRVVLFDLGASSKFAGVSSASFKLIQRFQQFGIPIDHMYAYEIKPTKELFKYAPRQMKAARELHMTYHWVTGGVSAAPGHAQNPFTTLQKDYTQDDFIIVKMDIDITELELQFAQQLLDTPELWRLVDLFYFEHHVNMQEMQKAWKTSMSGTIQDTLQLFTNLRERGIPAHYWI